MPERNVRHAETLMYSVVILTFNEEANLPRCLKSLSMCDDVVVIDSGSKDRTRDIAQESGARVFNHSFHSFAQQRNWANESITFSHQWVMHLDADECITPELHREILDVCTTNDKSAFLVANRLMFMGKWIRHASMYPTYQARLIRLGEANFRDAGHGTTLDRAVRGVGVLRQPYTHYNFSKGITDWLNRHNKYSSDEARRLLTADMPLLAALKQTAFGATPESRRQGLKRVADFVPALPLVRFLYLFIWKWGFLDGRTGLDYCFLMAYYDFLIRLKHREMKAAHRAAKLGLDTSAHAGDTVT